MLTNVTYEDTGVYRCIVASINGELEASTSSIRFIVREGSKIDHDNVIKLQLIGIL